jgi:hypothetical protein
VQVEDLSNLLNTGEVPNLFDTGELLAIGEAVRTRARAAHMDGSRADLLAFFVSEVRVRHDCFARGLSAEGNRAFINGLWCLYVCRGVSRYVSAHASPTMQ